MGESSPIDDTANSTNNTSAGIGQALHTTPRVNGEVSSTADSVKAIDDNDTVTSEAHGEAGSDAAAETPSAELSADPIGVHSAVADLSGGSDTDTSKADSLDHAKDLVKRHVRSNSVKKPAAFKSVSVTKNFLAKAATATPTARVGEKGTPGRMLRWF